MRRALILAALFALCGLIGWWGATWATPRVIMKIAMQGMEDRAGGPNRMIHAPPPTPQSRAIVRPSPDLLYSVCAFDLTGGDAALTIGAMQGYWSASFYDAATNNFHVLNSRTAVPGPHRFRLTRDEDGQSAADVIVSPGKRGAVLIRRRIGNMDDLQAAQRAQSQDACSAVE